MTAPPSPRELVGCSAILREALELAHSDAPCSPPAPRIVPPGTLTKRGVIWLGQTCNLRCSFCYFIDKVSSGSHPEHPFMGLEKAQRICRTLVEHYGNNAVDLQGGEPTIYPGIERLVAYCREIGLAPTLITNALALDNRESCVRLRAAGVADFLVSIQGLGEVHDRLVGVPGAQRRQMTALRHFRDLGIPFRFNCVMSKPAVSQLPEVALLARETGARAVNFITFNPFADQASPGKRCADNVPRYSEVHGPLTQALDLLDEAGIEANVRYFPLCMVEERHRKNSYNFQQLSYDPNEWDLASWGWTGLQPQRTRDGELTPPTGLAVPESFARLRTPMKRLAENSLLRPVLYRLHALLTRTGERGGDREELYRRVARLHAEKYCGYVFGPGCATCSLKGICDGIHGDYAEIFGTDETKPVPVADASMELSPLEFVKHQQKTVAG